MDWTGCSTLQIPTEFGIPIEWVSRANQENGVRAATLAMFVRVAFSGVPHHIN
jgi:hypothetical protein